MSGRKRPAELRQLLVIKLGSVGEAILLVPALRALRRALPGARIHWLASPTNRLLAENTRYVDEVHVLKSAAPVSFARMVAKLRRQRFDAVIDFEQSSRKTPVLAYGTGAPIRLGFIAAGEWRPKLFTDRYWKYFVRHDGQELLGLAGMLTPIVFDPTLELSETDEGRTEIQLLGWRRKGAGPLVVIEPGCGARGTPREWPLVNYAVLGNWMMQKFGAELVLASAPGDALKSASLNRLLNGKAMDLGDRLSWRGLAVILRQSDLFISGDSDLMNLASAAGCPQVTLHGPTSPVLRGPVNAKARVVTSTCPRCPCVRLGHEYHRRDQSCMARIDVDAVKDAVQSAFDKPGEI